MTLKTQKELEDFLLSNEDNIATDQNDFGLLINVFMETFSRDPKIK